MQQQQQQQRRQQQLQQRQQLLIYAICSKANAKQPSEGRSRRTTETVEVRERGRAEVELDLVTRLGGFTWLGLAGGHL